MKPRKRYSDEMQQEEISRLQFKRLIAERGWVSQGILPDLGEDIRIRIFREGVSTGLDFQVQLKSTKDIQNYQLSDGTISYGFDTDDIKNWGMENTPVYIVIWDTAKETGWYILIDEVIRKLDGRKKNWGEQGEVNIHIPLTNQLNENGLNKIQKYLTDQRFPILSQKRGLRAKLQIVLPDTEEGRKKQEEYKRHRAAGDPITFEPQFIQTVEFSDWYIRLFGEPAPDALRLTLGPGQPKPIGPCEIDIYSPDIGAERISNIVLYIIKGGVEEITISNAPQASPYQISLVVYKHTQQHQFTFSVDFAGLDAFDAKKAITIQQLLALGGNLRLTISKTGQDLIFEYQSGFTSPPLPSHLEFMDNIYFIQNRTGKRIHLDEKGSFSVDDFKNAEEMVSIIKSGTYAKSRMKASIKLLKPAIETLLEIQKKGERLQFRLLADESWFDILDQKFNLGPVMEQYTGRWTMPVEDVESWLADAGEEDVLEVEMEDVSFYEEFGNWMRTEPEDQEET
jgi:hypothetical protein